jgi:hypothetical protein
MGERRGTYRVLMGKHEGERALGRPKHRWEADIKMDLQELGWGAWTRLIWLRRGAGGKLCLGSIKCREFLDELRNF